jgi:hypothetical protein
LRGTPPTRRRTLAPKTDPWKTAPPKTPWMPCHPMAHRSTGRRMTMQPKTRARPMAAHCARTVPFSRETRHRAMVKRAPPAVHALREARAPSWHASVRWPRTPTAARFASRPPAGRSYASRPSSVPQVSPAWCRRGRTPRHRGLFVPPKPVSSPARRERAPTSHALPVARAWPRPEAERASTRKRRHRRVPPRASRPTAGRSSANPHAPAPTRYRAIAAAPETSSTEPTRRALVPKNGQQDLAHRPMDG